MKAFIVENGCRTSVRDASRLGGESRPGLMERTTTAQKSCGGGGGGGMGGDGGGVGGGWGGNKELNSLKVKS